MIECPYCNSDYGGDLIGKAVLMNHLGEAHRMPLRDVEETMLCVEAKIDACESLAIEQLPEGWQEKAENWWDRNYPDRPTSEMGRIKEKVNVINAYTQMLIQTNGVGEAIPPSKDSDDDDWLEQYSKNVDASKSKISDLWKNSDEFEGEDEPEYNDASIIPTDNLDKREEDIFNSQDLIRKDLLLETDSNTPTYRATNARESNAIGNYQDPAIKQTTNPDLMKEYNEALHKAEPFFVNQDIRLGDEQDGAPKILGKANGEEWGGIMSDDPTAVTQLKEKLTRLESEKEMIKARPIEPRDFSFSDNDMRGVELTNINAQIRSVKQRIQELGGSVFETYEEDEVELARDEMNDEKSSTEPLPWQKDGESYV